MKYRIILTTFLWHEILSVNLLENVHEYARKWSTLFSNLCLNIRTMIRACVTDTTRMIIYRNYICFHDINYSYYFFFKYVHHFSILEYVVCPRMSLNVTDSNMLLICLKWTRKMTAFWIPAANLCKELYHSEQGNFPTHKQIYFTRYISLGSI